MRAQFKDVLALEGARLADVVDAAGLDNWRRHILEEFTTPTSPYASALRSTGEALDRAEFIDRWRTLIEDTVARVHRSSSTNGRSHRGTTPSRTDADPRQLAVSILAALHGGGALSHVAQDAWPLKAALDIALAPVLGPPATNKP